jgi:hypothetical protein
MHTPEDITGSPEWASARQDWREQSGADLERLEAHLAGAAPGVLKLEAVYTPLHDMAGLAGVLGYPLMGRIARELIETLRRGADPLDANMLLLARAHIAALRALHEKNVPGDGGAAGSAVMAKLASLHARLAG